MRRADDLTTFMCLLSRNSGSLNHLEPSGLSRDVQGQLSGRRNALNRPSKDLQRFLLLFEDFLGMLHCVSLGPSV